MGVLWSAAVPLAVRELAARLSSVLARRAHEPDRRQARPALSASQVDPPSTAPWPATTWGRCYIVVMTTEQAKVPERHFPGCHPEDSEAPLPVEGALPQDSEPCWHCATDTPRGCICALCWESADEVPPTCMYHCMVCNRYWAWLTLRITTFTIPPQKG